MPTPFDYKPNPMNQSTGYQYNPNPNQSVNPYAITPTFGVRQPMDQQPVYPQTAQAVPPQLTGGKQLDMGNIERNALFTPLGGEPQAKPTTVKIGGANVPFKVFEDAARPLAEWGVRPEDVVEYAKPEANRGKYVSPSQAAATKASDNEWAKEAFRVGVLTGDKWRDDLIWREHWAFMQGVSGRDPLLTGHPESVQRLMGRAEQIAQSQGQSQYGDERSQGQPQGQPQAEQPQGGFTYGGGEPIGLDSPETRQLRSFRME